MEQPSKARWYIVQVYAGAENKVASSIIELAAKRGLESSFEEVYVPTEDVIEIKNGKPVTVAKKYLPGYVLVKMVMNDDSWHLVRSIPRVSNLLGNKGKPSPISDAEANRIVVQAKEASERPRSAILFEAGDVVKILDGPFASFTGTVEEIDDDKQRLKVSVMIFGRNSPVDLEYSQVEKSLG